MGESATSVLSWTSSSGTWKTQRHARPLDNPSAKQKIVPSSPVPRHLPFIVPVPVPRHLSSSSSPVPVTAFPSIPNFKTRRYFSAVARNWDFIADSIVSLKTDKPKVLNLFAWYRWCFPAASQGADVIHLDSVSKLWFLARENMELSNLDNIRWVVKEDATTFVKTGSKEEKNTMELSSILPHNGHGTDGERWKLEDLPSMKWWTRFVAARWTGTFFILNTYSLGFSSLIIENLLAGVNNLNTGELYSRLPAGGSFHWAFWEVLPGRIEFFRASKGARRLQRSSSHFLPAVGCFVGWWLLVVGIVAINE